MFDYNTFRQILCALQTAKDYGILSPQLRKNLIDNGKYISEHCLEETMFFNISFPIIIALYQNIENVEYVEPSEVYGIYKELETIKENCVSDDIEAEYGYYVYGVLKETYKSKNS